MECIVWRQPRRLLGELRSSWRVLGQLLSVLSHISSALMIGDTVRWSTRLVIRFCSVLGTYHYQVLGS